MVFTKHKASRHTGFPLTVSCQAANGGVSAGRWDSLGAATVAIIVIVSLAMPICAQEPDWNCLTKSKKPRSFYAILQGQAYAALTRRDSVVRSLSTPEAIVQRQADVRRQMAKMLGGFPDAGPLNAKVVGVIPADGYRIEKVIYDSVPHHRITANLYLPDGNGPFSAVVVSSGHSRTAKTADYNQRFGIAMAKHGMAALCFDPIGQGERSQFVRKDGSVLHSGTTTEHFLIGVGSTLVGRNTARYRIWDAMRSIDYLQSRKEIKAKRIGMTGCSGGGTLTSYTMALDDRIWCAAPACYLTNFRRLIETIGPQDAEQNIFAQLALGIDQPDYIFMRAPRPTLISATSGDFFPIAGSWESFQEAKLVYGMLQHPERIDLVETAGKHGVTPQNLATITHWMKRWLDGVDMPVKPVVYEAREPSELLCTPHGQVMSEDGEKSVLDLNREWLKQLEQRRTVAKQKPNADVRLRKELRKRLSWSTEKATRSKVGEFALDDCHVEKWIVRSSSGTAIPTIVPTIVLTPRVASKVTPPTVPTVLMLEDGGKASDLKSLRKLAASGRRVIAVDLPGQGETAGAASRSELLGDWKTYYLSYLLGDSLTACRARAIGDVLDFAGPRPVEIRCHGKTGVAALHMAAIEPTRIERLVLQNVVTSWASIVASNNPVGQVDHVIHDALSLYDLPDLERLIGNEKVERKE